MPPINPAPGSRGRRVRTFPTPDIRDFVFHELRDRTLPLYETAPEHGTPHPEKDLFPDFFLVGIAPTEEATPDMQRWFYARERKDQEKYNFRITRDQELIRTYVVLRSDFIEWEETNGNTEALEIPDRGDVDPLFDGWTFGSFTVARIEDEVIDSMFVMLRFAYANTGDSELDLDPGPASGITEAGTQEGERSVDSALGSVATAEPVEGGVVLRRQSSLTESGLYDNEEEQLDVREGDGSVVEDLRDLPGVKRTVSRGLSLTEPAATADDATFRKELRSVDVLGADAYWEYERTIHEDNPVTGSGISRLLGAGLFDETRSLVDDGEDADVGFLIDESEVIPLGEGDAIKRTRSLTDFPILIEDRFDEEVDELLRITKETIPAQTESGSVAAGDITEIVPYDRWRDIKVNSVYVTSPEAKSWTLPYTRTWQYPAVLTAVRLVYTNAYASATNGYSYDEALVPEFDLNEGFETTIEGRLIRTITATPPSVFSTPNLYKPQSYSLAYSAAWWFTTPGGGAFARANARVWQTPMALVENDITITAPTWSPGTGVTVDGEVTGTISATDAPPTGWVTIRVQTRKLKMGFFEVLEEQVKLESPF